MIAEVLAALAEGLGSAGIRWYLFGAQAAILYGVPRLTADVDATAEYPVDQAEELARLLLEAGFEARVGDIGAFARRTRVIPLAHVPTGIPVDLVLAGAGLEEEFLDRAQLIDVGGLRVPVITADDLIVTKVLAGRSKDLEDVRDLLRQQGVSLDLGQDSPTLKRSGGRLGPRLWDTQSGVVSTRVLQEFYITTTRKLSRPLPRRAAREVVGTYRAWPLQRPDSQECKASKEGLPIVGG